MGQSVSDTILYGPQNEDAIAILSPGQTPLTYGRLRKNIVETVKQLNSMGYGKNDRIIVVLPSGPEMAVTFLSIASGFTCVPLNPGFTEHEFKNYLEDIKPKAVLTLADSDSPIIAIAKNIGLPILRILTTPAEGAGLFHIAGDNGDFLAPSGFAGPDDIALILLTSGSTYRPKRVPLTHLNLCSSAMDFISSFNLTKNDRCLAIVPLFYINGLCSVLFSSLAVGGSVVCTPGYDQEKFLDWLNEFKPTWYSAVPTIHKVILEQSRTFPAPLASSLRYIRSAGSALPDQVRLDLEHMFNSTVLEGYGMTECPRISGNPLPPGVRKPGSVGVPGIGVQVAIIGEDGKFLPAGQSGEIVISGPSVMKGYYGEDELNLRSFVNGWFKTGDQGYFDKDGYLFINGRIKELINRGGEMISPIEIENVLASHPNIKEAVVFSMPDEILGEIVAAAIVLRDSINADPDEFRSYIARYISYTKVPYHIFFIDKIPKLPSGKVQRNGILNYIKQLNRISDSISRREIPADQQLNNNERQMQNIWEESFGRSPISVNDNFFNIGGNSLIAVQIFAKIDTRFKIRLPFDTIIMSPTIRQLSLFLDRTDAKPLSGRIVPLQPNGTKTPLFCIHTIGASLLQYEGLAKCMGEDRPIYGILPQGLDGNEKPLDSIEEMAALYIKRIREIQPNGPYNLLGFSAAGSIAYEMARQLDLEGQQVGFAGLLDHPAPNQANEYDKTRIMRYMKNINLWSARFYYHFFKVRSNKKTDILKNYRVGVNAIVMRKIYTIRNKPLPDRLVYQPFVMNLPGPERNVSMRFFDGLRKYRPGVYNGKITLFVAEETDKESYWLSKYHYYDPKMGWGKLVKDGVDVITIPGYHVSILLEPNLQILAKKINECLYVFII